MNAKVAPHELSSGDRVVLDHGTGAKLSQELLRLIVETLGESYVGVMEDSATLPRLDGQLAMTTDSFVADPPIFGNGDIGKIAVCGTVNDLAVAGAKPLYLTLAMILETGFPLSKLVSILSSVRDTALEAGVKIVAGDTKVVREGEADQIFLNTSGVGVIQYPMSMDRVCDGDAIILTGPIGNHTIHLLSIREGLGFEGRVLSDCAPLNGMLEELLARVPKGAIRSIRDVTRGGLSAVMHEYSSRLDRKIVLQQDDLPIQHETRMASEMLGVDPIHAANEGCLCLFVDREQVEIVLATLRGHKYGTAACCVGRITSEPGHLVLLSSASGSILELEELAGAELPRLC